MRKAEGNVVHLQRNADKITNELLFKHSELVFQPRQLIGSKRLLGVEALLRWHHSAYGNLSAEAIIALAEQRQIINSFTLHLLDKALLEFEHLCAQHKSLQVLTLSFNVSPQNFKSERFLPELQALCKKYTIAPQQLILDFPEAMVSQNEDEALISMLTAYRKAGFKLALDDFGTADATAPIIERLHLHELKVDVKVIAALGYSKEAEFLAKAALRLAAHAGILTTAEGVENAETLALIDELGFDIVQGYTLSKPLTAPELKVWCANYQENRSSVS